MNKLYTSLIFLVLITACDESSTPTDSAANSSASISMANDATDEELISLQPEMAAAVRDLMEAYLSQIDKGFIETTSELQTFTMEVDAFLENPTAESISALRTSWIRAHNSFETAAIHRFFATNILPQAQALQAFELQYQLNHWPILPGYIDYVDNYPESGIVNDMTVSLAANVLREQHGVFDINEASTGFHVVEFLLWGENNTDSSLRPYTDYLPATTLNAQQQADGLELFQLSNNRRRQLLDVSSEIMNDDFQTLVNIWAANSVQYRAAVDESSAEQLLMALLNSITSLLTEELLVRSLYPMLNGEFSESLPAIFSRSSPAAVSAQLAGLENLLLETNLDSGMNFDGVFTAISDDFAEYFYANFDASKECLVVLYATEDLPQTPLQSADMEFKVVECINFLTNMSDYLEQIKFSLEIQV